MTYTKLVSQNVSARQFKNKTATAKGSVISMVSHSQPPTNTFYQHLLRRPSKWRWLVVDSGALDHLRGRQACQGTKQLMFNYQESDTPRTITTAGLHTLLGTPRKITEQGHRRQRPGKNGDSTHHNCAWYRARSIVFGCCSKQGCYHHNIR